jgi:hypothetical protein
MRRLYDEIPGYIEYSNKLLYNNYSSDDMKKIIAHRDDLRGKLINTEGATRQEIQNAGKNYKNLTDDEAMEILVKASKSSAHQTIGAAYTKKFFMPTMYDGVIVDAEDVFAVAFTHDSSADIDVRDGEALMCILITNDPYIPVMPMMLFAERGFFDFMKCKKGREMVKEMFESHCPNLQYPVQDIRDLRKQIKKEETVRGNLDKKFVLDKLLDANICSSIFNEKKLNDYLQPMSLSMLNNMGYIYEKEICNLLGMDGMFSGKYWKKQLKNLENSHVYSL